jgi:putative ABC transport system ATP-binding protein
MIVGPNGAGKSTLLRVLAGDCTLDRGQMRFYGEEGVEDLRNMPRWERAQRIAQIHQDPKRGTVGSMTVFENLRLASLQRVMPSPFGFDSAGRTRNWFESRIESIGLSGKLDSRVADLSQGQRQLLALELALLRQPSVLLADEHTASLDQDNARKCLETTVRLCRDQATTVIMVTHNLEDATRYGDRLIVLRRGKIHADLDNDQRRALGLKGLIELCGYEV